MRVRDLMTHPVHVTGPNAPAWEAVGMMRRLGIRRLPVMENGALIGIVTWTDLVRVRPPAVGGRYTVPNLAAGVLVRHLMTSDPITISPQTPIEEAAVVMRRHKIGGLPVVDAGQLAGIITESDLFDAFVEAFAIRPGEARLHVPVRALAADLARIVPALADEGVGLLAIRTIRGRDASALDLAVREEDAARAGERLRRLGFAVDVESLLHSGVRR